jgi:flagellar biosynthesis component FlhA
MRPILSLDKCIQGIKDNETFLYEKIRFHIDDCIKTEKRVDELEDELEKKRNAVIEECMDALVPYAFTSHSFSILRKLQEK